MAPRSSRLCSCGTRLPFEGFLRAGPSSRCPAEHGSVLEASPWLVCHIRPTHADTDRKVLCTLIFLSQIWCRLRDASIVARATNALSPASSPRIAVDRACRQIPCASFASVLQSQNLPASKLLVKHGLWDLCTKSK